MASKGLPLNLNRTIPARQYRRLAEQGGPTLSRHSKSRSIRARSNGGSRTPRLTKGAGRCWPTPIPGPTPTG